MALAPGPRARIQVTVGPEDLATALGSGDVPVLGTPRLLALAEAATVQAVQGRLDPGTTSVGTRVELDHLAASPPGAQVEITAELTEVHGRRLVFTVTATEGERTVARGVVERTVVDRDRFLARLGGG